MNISLRVRLDDTRDRLVVELEPGKVARTVPLQVGRENEIVEIDIDADGYVLGLSLPGLTDLLAELAPKPAGKPETPGKPGKGK